jgi:hypothetical protein
MSDLEPMSTLSPNLRYWVAGTPRSLLARSSLVLPISPTHLGPTVPDGFAPVSRLGCNRQGAVSGASISHFGKDLILYLREPNYKQGGDSKCFSDIGLGPVGQGWQRLPPGQRQIAQMLGRRAMQSG